MIERTSPFSIANPGHFLISNINLGDLDLDRSKLIVFHIVFITTCIGKWPKASDYIPYFLDLKLDLNFGLFLIKTFKNDNFHIMYRFDKVFNS